MTSRPTKRPRRPLGLACTRMICGQERTRRTSRTTAFRGTATALATRMTQIAPWAYGIPNRNEPRRSLCYTLGLASSAHQEQRARATALGVDGHGLSDRSEN